MNRDRISRLMQEHYKKTFELHGKTSMGVDWGHLEGNHMLRNLKMLELIRDPQQSHSLLDVGCGYGSLAETLTKGNYRTRYTGVDLVEEMVTAGRKSFPSGEFIMGDFLSMPETKQYDYVVCSGILTQKLSANNIEMIDYSKRLVKKMYEICKVGIAFNTMSTYVNYHSDNLFYQNPSELLGWCMSELTPRAKLDAAYQLRYEYTVYLYR